MKIQISGSYKAYAQRVEEIRARPGQSADVAVLAEAWLNLAASHADLTKHFMELTQNAAFLSQADVEPDPRRN